MSIELTVNLIPQVAIALWLLWAGIWLFLICSAAICARADMAEKNYGSLAFAIWIIVFGGYQLLRCGQRLAAWMAVLLPD